jgi:hypothetical protein
MFDFLLFPIPWNFSSMVWNPGNPNNNPPYSPDDRETTVQDFNAAGLGGGKQLKELT